MFGAFGLLEPYISAHKIIENDFGTLWLGDYQAALDKVDLKNKGIKTVISCLQGVNFNYEKDPYFNHKFLRIIDSPDFKINQYFDESFEIIDKGLKVGSVLVHCAMGISRSTTIVIAYIMKKYNLTYTQAYNHVKKRRAIVAPNYGFSRQLKDYEQQLIKKPQQSLKTEINIIFPEIKLNIQQPVVKYTIQRRKSYSINIKNIKRNLQDDQLTKRLESCIHYY